MRLLSPSLTLRPSLSPQPSKGEERCALSDWAHMRASLEGQEMWGPPWRAGTSPLLSLLPHVPASFLLGQRWGCPEAKHLLHQALDQVLSSCGASPTHGHWSQPDDRSCKGKHGCGYAGRAEGGGSQPG